MLLLQKAYYKLSTLQEDQPFTPKHKKKGRSSSAKQFRRKKGVQEEDKRVCTFLYSDWFICHLQQHISF
jgi:hypothetical protein